MSSQPQQACPNGTQPQKKLSADEELALEVAKYYDDPLGFVMFAYPWGQPGILEHEEGPDVWQAEELEKIGREVRKRKFNGRTPVMPIRVAISSGHGTGKSTLAAWIVDWIMSTRPNSQGTITANTFTQLDTKTWASITKWTKRCITARWFVVTGDRMYRDGEKESWFCSPQTCAEENSEAFAGQHAADSTSFYLFDEASAIPHKIYEVAEGGLSDGEPMIFLFGNATKSNGDFYDAVFGAQMHKWLHRSIDSRDCRMTNKQLIQEWLETHGIGSDFFRVRVLGLPPNASDSQFIDFERIREAQKREVIVDESDPLICGGDLAWGGDDNNVFFFRRGKDARSIPPVVIPGEQTRDANVLAAKIAEILSGTYDGKKVKMMFLDSAGISGAVLPKVQALGFNNITEINFGQFAPNMKYENMRAYMWGMTKDFLLTGAISKNKTLESDLASPGYSLTSKTKVLLESKKDMKKRIGRSPDYADGLALTFARFVAPEKKTPDYDNPTGQLLVGREYGWMR